MISLNLHGVVGIKRLARLFLMLVIVILMAGADRDSIQAQIDAAEPGTTIKLGNRTYEETIVIDKPVHILGDSDTKLINDSTQPAITITTNEASVRNLTIETKGVGIMLDGANGNVLSQLEIIGDPINREHGIELWKSDKNEISHSRMTDVKDATIQHNIIVDNRIGIFMDESRENVIAFNDIKRNYIGLQMKQTEKNQIHHNAFTSNVVQGQAEGSSENETSENYWGNHQGLNFTGGNTSDLPYEVDPFFLHVTNQYPPFQLLFDSPGMRFVETLIDTPPEERLVDQAPLLENPLTIAKIGSESSSLKVLVSVMALLVSSFIILMGVKKS